MIEELARAGLDLLGVQGVSVSVVALLLVAYLYTGKAATAGGVVVGGASSAAHTAKVVVAALLVLLLLGVVSVDVAQAQQYVETARSIRWMELARRAMEVVG